MKRRRSVKNRGARSQGNNMQASLSGLRKKELFRVSVEYLALDLAVGFLFYRSLWAVLLFLPGFFLYVRFRREDFQRQRMRLMNMEFLSGMQLLSTSLQAGYAVENACLEAEKELGHIYEQDAFICKEFARIHAGIRLNIPVEKLFLELGERSHLESAINFAEVFATAKRTGGDVNTIVRNTADQIRQQEETLQEIETELSGKQMEVKMMSFLPLLILSYVTLTSNSLLQILYHNPAGIMIMSLCLVLYGTAVLWSRKIMAIEV